jgi:hypothetical protein
MLRGGQACGRALSSDEKAALLETIKRVHPS